jgi:hypothetical protein
VGTTTDPNDPCLVVIEESGMQACYLVLSEEELGKGFVRPIRHSYVHVKCGTVTTMAQPIAETYARDPKFYGGTYCAGCKTHFRLRTFNEDGTFVPQFRWDDDRTPVGS